MNPFRLTYTAICAKVRQHLPARRMRPGELQQIADEMHALLAAHLATGETYSAAYARITIGMIAALKECSPDAKTWKP